MESNGVLGNSQHCVILGGRDSQGRDQTNALSWLALRAYDELGGTVNQLCVRLHEGTQVEFAQRASAWG